MRHRILWLWLWITVTLWLGNITGCSTPQQQAQHDPEASTQAMVDAWAQQWKPPVDASSASCCSQVDGSSKDGETCAATTCAECQPTPTRCGPMAAGDVCSDCQGETTCPAHTAPIMTPTMQRDHWPAIHVQAHPGRTRHWPIYFQDCPMYNPEADPLAAPGTEASLRAALSDSKAENYSGNNVQAAVTQPIKAVFDLLAWPVRAFVNPPFVTNTTPQ